MKALFLIASLVLVSTAHADGGGCAAYGRTYAEGEQDCDGRVCGKDGIWTGVVKSGVCDVTDEDSSGRDPASVKKHKKAKHAKPRKKKHPQAVK